MRFLFSSEISGLNSAVQTTRFSFVSDSQLCKQSCSCKWLPIVATVNVNVTVTVTPTVTVSVFKLSKQISADDRCIDIYIWYTDMVMVQSPVPAPM